MESLEKEKSVGVRVLKEPKDSAQTFEVWSQTETMRTAHPRAIYSKIVARLQTIVKKPVDLKGRVDRCPVERHSAMPGKTKVHPRLLCVCGAPGHFKLHH